MSSIEILLQSLSERFPEDAEEVSRAGEVFRQQRLSSCELLADLTESQWQRLQLPMGIEARIRKEVQAGAQHLSAEVQVRAAAGHEHLEEDLEERQPLLAQQGAAFRQPAEVAAAGTELSGLRRRGGRNTSRRDPGGLSEQIGQSNGTGLLSEVDFKPPSDLEELWQQLLEDTLSPDKRDALQETWESIGSSYDKYMMYLEYSSYLRKPQMTEADKEARKKQLEPLMREFGLSSKQAADMDEDESDGPSSLLGCVVCIVMVFVVGVVCYSYSLQDAQHDLNNL